MGCSSKYQEITGIPCTVLVVTGLNGIRQASTPSGRTLQGNEVGLDIECTTDDQNCFFSWALVDFRKEFCQRAFLSVGW